MRPHKKNILSSLLPRRSKRQRLQELLLALKLQLARPSPQPLSIAKALLGVSAWHWLLGLGRDIMIYNLLYNLEPHL